MNEPLLSALDLSSALDLTRYPLDRSESDAYRQLIEECQQGLEARGAAILDGFMRSEALSQAVAEVSPNLGEAFFKVKSHNPYLIPDDEAYGEEHPRNRKQMTDSATLGYRFISRESLVNALYCWQPFKDFLARVLGFPALHPYVDPLAPVNILVYRPGCQTGWHFDNATFVVTLLLQEGEAGGEFEYAPFIRDGSDFAFETVSQILEERSDLVCDMRQKAGTLVIFKGHRTLHRVKPVIGERDRLVTVFSYSPEEGKELLAHTRKTFYGRVD